MESDYKTGCENTSLFVFYKLTKCFFMIVCDLQIYYDVNKIINIKGDGSMLYNRQQIL